jgi:quercetin dioxygenase-like cupin family protein
MPPAAPPTAPPATPPADVLVATAALPWKPLRETIAFKLLHWDAATGAFAVLYRFAAGARVARHRHLAPAEYYVLSGTMDYRAGRATAGTWGLEPTGAVHEETAFPEETTLLYRAAGPTVLLDDADAPLAIVDGAMLARLWHGG